MLIGLPDILRLECRFQCLRITLVITSRARLRGITASYAATLTFRSSVRVR